MENSVLSMAAVGLAVDEEAASEAGAACSAACSLLDQLFPAVLAALRTGHDEIAAAGVPFLLSYVTRLKAVQVRRAWGETRAGGLAGWDGWAVVCLLEWSHPAWPMCSVTTCVSTGGLKQSVMSVDL